MAAVAAARPTTTYAVRPAPAPEPLVPTTATLKICHAISLCVEATEGLQRGSCIDFDAVDGCLGDAMRRIASARSAILDLKRQRLGQPTIAGSEG